MAVAVIAGSANRLLASELAAQLPSAALIADAASRFPDGECFVRIAADLAGQQAVVVQSSYPDENYVELLLLLDAAREAGASQVTAVIPYMGYARQDRAFQSGEAVASRAVARGVAALADTVLAVDPHKESILDFYACDRAAVSAVSALAKQLGEWGVEVILAPDAGARDRAARAADALGIPSDYLEKTRLGPEEVVMKAKDLDVAGKRVAIVDDMIASGGTMITAARQLKAQGATAVYAACTHGLFTGGAVPKLLAGGIDRVLATDSLEPTGCDVVSAAPAIAAALAPRIAI